LYYMYEFLDRIAQLSPVKRALLQRLLLEKQANAVSSLTIPRRGEYEVIPLSFAQQRLWFLDQLEGASAAYNMSAAVRLSGTLHVRALQQGLTEITRRHEMLRTTFPVVNGSPVQVVNPSQPLSITVEDLQSLAMEEQTITVYRLAAEEAQRPFNLAQGPLSRITLLRLNAEEHVLLVTMHHIVSDGWSIGVFLREWATLYETYVSGKPAPLPELPIQYADFALWQRQWLTAEVLEPQVNYWKQQLAGAPAVLELPTDRPRPLVRTFHGGIKRFQLRPELTLQLETLSRQARTTLHMTLLGAFATLLFRYSRQQDMVIGSPVASRNRKETESLIGFFVNMLVWRLNLEGDPTFAELLTRVRQVALEAFAHQDLPFEKLVEELQPARTLSYNPLCQATFAWQEVPVGRVELPGLALTPLEVEQVTTPFDLSLMISSTEQGLFGEWEYNSDLFDATTIDRMVGHFQTLLEEIAANPAQRLSELSLLTAAERHQLLVAWNNTQAAYPQDVCIHQLFEAQVERCPDAVAVVYEDQQLTYQELNRRANQLAHYLRALGVGPEVLVGLCLERSLDLIVGLLGILKAGGAFVPLIPDYPTERLAFILEDAQLPVLVTRQQLVARLPEHWAQVVWMDTDSEGIVQESEENPVSSVTAENLAYVMYTSGSTGRPKGVLIAHGGLCNLITVEISLFDVQPTSRVIQFVSLSSDAATPDVFRVLCAGATLYLASKDSLPHLTQVLRDQAITHAALQTSVLAVLPAEELPALRAIMTGGEACSAELVTKWTATGRRFLNAYGPTEATVTATIAECTADGRQPPIGRPIANVQVYILDSHLQPAPIGMPGELHIGGVGLARGYLNRPELTKEKFIPNPFSDDLGARLYKTGDSARYLSDGNIEFLGRLDHQVKIRNYRIELGEIEAVLAQHPSVQETVVMVREDPPGDKRLVAYVVPHLEPAPTPSELRRFLSQKLPEYMVPAVFVTLETLPRLPNRKVDRRALPAPDTSRQAMHVVFVAPHTRTEKVLADMWANLLGLQQVGVDDNFFDLGGHSLLATQVIARIRDAFSLELPLRSVFEHPTVAGLAECLETFSWAARGQQAPSYVTVGEREEGEV
jgi:amino acid adenylation domain-containing protein